MRIYSALTYCTLTVTKGSGFVLCQHSLTRTIFSSSSPPSSSRFGLATREVGRRPGRQMEKYHHTLKFTGRANTYTRSLICQITLFTRDNKGSHHSFSFPMPSASHDATLRW